jgi:hypothetical protein
MFCRGFSIFFLNSATSSRRLNDDARTNALISGIVCLVLAVGIFVYALAAEQELERQRAIASFPRPGEGNGIPDW